MQQKIDGNVYLSSVAKSAEAMNIAIVLRSLWNIALMELQLSAVPILTINYVLTKVVVITITVFKEVI